MVMALLNPQANLNGLAAAEAKGVSLTIVSCQRGGL